MDSTDYYSSNDNADNRNYAY